MKIRNKNSFLITLLFLISSTICPMDQTNRNEESLGWIALAGTAIASGTLTLKLFLSYAHSQPTTFTDLPQQIQQKIMNLVLTRATTESLPVAAGTINSLAQVNKYFNILINSDQYCTDMIRALASRFSSDPLIVIDALQITVTKNLLKRLEEQEKKPSLCFVEPSSSNDTRELKK